MAKQKEQKETYNFDNYEEDALTKPRDLSWSNWAKFSNVGEKVQGFIRDAFFRSAEGQYPAQRGITLEQPNGELINVPIKRHDFILDKTDYLRIGDPLTVVLEEEKPAQTKGFNPTKIYGFYGRNLDSTEGNPTVKELDSHDEEAGGSSGPQTEEQSEADAQFDGEAF